MSSTKRLRAQAMVSFALQVAPPEQANWIRAMESEMAHIPDDDLISFAFGGVIAACRARLISALSIVAAARWLLIVGAAAWATLNIWFAGRMSSANAYSLEVSAYVIAAAFALGAIATARFGFKATIVLGAPLMCLLGLAALLVRNILPNSPIMELHFALILENLAVLLFALLIAFAIPRLAIVKRATRQ